MASRTRHVATLDEGRELLRVFGYVPGSVRPTLARPTIDTGKTNGTCCACDRPVAEFAPRHAGWTYNTREVLIHAECSAALGGHELIPDDNTDRPQRSTPDQRRAYRRALSSMRTPTLYSMVCAYEETAPDERSADMAWRIAIVEDEIERRLGKTLDGGVVDVDERLRAAAQNVDRLVESDPATED